MSSFSRTDACPEGAVAAHSVEGPGFAQVWLQGAGLCPSLLAGAGLVCLAPVPGLLLHIPCSLPAQGAEAKPSKDESFCSKILL